MDLLWARLLHKETDLFACVAYFIWGQRNKVMHEGTVPNPMAVVKQAKLLYSGYKESLPTLGHLMHNSDDNRTTSSRGVRWLPPSMGRYKVNWAISRVSNSQEWFVRVLVRDLANSVLAARCCQVKALPKGIHPSIGACIQVLQFVIQLGFFVVEVEGPEIAILKDAHGLTFG